MLAGHNANPDVASVLLKAGADIKARNSDGWSSLMWAARYSSNPEEISLLLKAGADINDQSNDGWTSLMIAAKYNTKPEVVVLLLRAGADSRAKSRAGKAAFDYAQENVNLKGSDALKQLEEASK
jgi:ankyrin repeat protein